MAGYILKYEGEEKSLSKWAHEYETTARQIVHALKRGLPTSDALRTGTRCVEYIDLDAVGLDHPKVRRVVKELRRLKLL